MSEVHLQSSIVESLLVFSVKSLNPVNNTKHGSLSNKDYLSFTVQLFKLECDEVKMKIIMVIHIQLPW